jgi:hypothetical protein
VSGQAVYHGDSDERFSLLIALQRTSTRSREDRLTAVLAWLCSLSPSVAFELARLLLRDDDQAIEALGSGPVKVKTQVPLADPETAGMLHVDLSLAVPDRALQLLVEVKLDAGLAAEQPENYIEAWRQCPKEFEARVRRVGTITVPGESKDGEAGPSDVEIKRACDIRWDQVLVLLGPDHGILLRSDHQNSPPLARA